MEERMRCCYSLREAAQLTEISPTTLHSWEADRTRPKPGPALRRLSELYEVDPLYLLTGVHDRE